jgi:hypothetical protein
MGTTIRSSSIINVYYSLIYQIIKLFSPIIDILGLPRKNLNKTELKEYLRKQLDLLEQAKDFKNKKLVIILDSIDQLNAADYILDWFLDEFPACTKFVYSTLGNYGGILERLQSDNRILKDNIIDIQSEIYALDKEKSKLIIEDWLKMTDRKLSENQWKIINDMIKNTENLYPLYLKLLFDISSKWPSFHEPTSDFIECSSIDKCIAYLFKKLEDSYGRLFFQRVIIYLTSFRNGITNFELEDICSLDDELLADILEFHDYPVRRFPIALWTRMKYELENYLVEKEADKTKVISWYHR